MNPETVKYIEQYGAWLIGGNLDQEMARNALKELYQITFGKSQAVCDEFVLYLSSFLSQARLNLVNQFFIECESLNTNGFLRNSCLLKPLLKLEKASHQVPEECDFGVPRVLLQHYQTKIEQILWQECQTKQDYVAEKQKNIYMANTILKHMQFNLGIETSATAQDIYAKIVAAQFEIVLDPKPSQMEALKKFWLKEMEDFFERIQSETQFAIEAVIQDSKEKTSSMNFFKNPLQTVRNLSQDYQATHEVKKFKLRLIAMLEWVLNINPTKIPLSDLTFTYMTACQMLQGLAIEIEAMIDANNQLEAKMKVTSAAIAKQLEQKFVVLQQTEIPKNKSEDIDLSDNAVDLELLELLQTIQSIDVLELDARLVEAEKQIADRKAKRGGIVFDPGEVRQSLHLQTQKVETTKRKHRAVTLTKSDLEALQTMSPAAAPSDTPATPSRSTLS